MHLKYEWKTYSLKYSWTLGVEGSLVGGTFFFSQGKSFSKLDFKRIFKTKSESKVLRFCWKLLCLSANYECSLLKRFSLIDTILCFLLGKIKGSVLPIFMDSWNGKVGNTAFVSKVAIETMGWEKRNLI